MPGNSPSWPECGARGANEFRGHESRQAPNLRWSATCGWPVCSTCCTQRRASSSKLPRGAALRRRVAPAPAQPRRRPRVPPRAARPCAGRQLGRRGTERSATLWKRNIVFGKARAADPRACGSRACCCGVDDSASDGSDETTLRVTTKGPSLCIAWKTSRAPTAVNLGLAVPDPAMSTPKEPGRTRRVALPQRSASSSVLLTARHHRVAEEQA